mmetsp:Transcript_22853/g.40409  ORF Transcript_22853/g.40409 Transcript_22853/m.40409 type:complete len:347 (-) Transcript_22853:82-1122(-)
MGLINPLLDDDPPPKKKDSSFYSDPLSGFKSATPQSLDLQRKFRPQAIRQNPASNNHFHSNQNNINYRSERNNYGFEAKQSNDSFYSGPSHQFDNNPTSSNGKPSTVPYKPYPSPPLDPFPSGNFLPNPSFGLQTPSFLPHYPILPSPNQPHFFHPSRSIHRNDSNNNNYDDNPDYNDEIIDNDDTEKLNKDAGVEPPLKKILRRVEEVLPKPSTRLMMAARRGNTWTEEECNNEGEDAEKLDDLLEDVEDKEEGEEEKEMDVDERQRRQLAELYADEVDVMTKDLVNERAKEESIPGQKRKLASSFKDCSVNLRKYERFYKSSFSVDPWVTMELPRAHFEGKSSF